MQWSSLPQVGPNEQVTGVTTYFGITFRCKAAVLTTGTFMNGTIWVGKQSMAAGRWAQLLLPSCSQAPGRQVRAACTAPAAHIAGRWGSYATCLAASNHVFIYG